MSLRESKLEQIMNQLKFLSLMHFFSLVIMLSSSQVFSQPDHRQMNLDAELVALITCGNLLKDFGKVEVMGIRMLTTTTTSEIRLAQEQISQSLTFAGVKSGQRGLWQIYDLEDEAASIPSAAASGLLPNPRPKACFHPVTGRCMTRILGRLHNALTATGRPPSSTEPPEDCRPMSFEDCRSRNEFELQYWPRIDEKLYVLRIYPTGLKRVGIRGSDGVDTDAIAASVTWINQLLLNIQSVDLAVLRETQNRKADRNSMSPLVTKLNSCLFQLDRIPQRHEELKRRIKEAVTQLTNPRQR